MKLKYILILVFFAGLALFYFVVDPSGVGYLPKCPLYTTTGIYCPGCGSQRATYDLLHLNFSGVISHNALYFIALILLVYHSVIMVVNRLFNKKWKSVLSHPKMPIIVLAVILLFWILRNLPYAPFNWLAPTP